MEHILGIVFPGQGAQFVGMGSELYTEFETARQVFSEVTSVTGRDIAGLCFEGPREELDMTVNTQIAVLTVDVAAFRVFAEHIALKPAVMAGHSLGEYAALTAAGALSLSDTIRLVHARGTFMQEAVPPGEGAMAALLGMGAADVDALCRRLRAEGEVVEPANYNGPDQVVISGAATGIERALHEAKGHGAKRAIMLPISVPCHCRLLESAAARLDVLLSSLPIGDCTPPVISNYEPLRTHSRSATRELLVHQLSAPVRWQETIEAMVRQGVDTIIEIGPKKTLSGLIKRIAPPIRLFNIEDMKSLDETVRGIKDA